MKQKSREYNEKHREEIRNKLKERYYKIKISPEALLKAKAARKEWNDKNQTHIKEMQQKYNEKYKQARLARKQEINDTITQKESKEVPVLN